MEHKDFVQMACYFTFYKKITLTQIAYISETYHNMNFQDLTLSELVTLKPLKFTWLP